MMQTPPDTILSDHAIVDGRRIAIGRHLAEAQGSRDLVLIHGTPSHSYIWRNVIPILQKSNCNVYVFDLLGFGRSERPLTADTSVAAQGAVLLKLLDRWRLHAPHIVGHDIGGAISMRHAVFSPDRLKTLTIIDACSYDSWPSETWRKIIADHLASYASLDPAEFKAMLTRQLKMTVHKEAGMPAEVLETYLSAIAGPIGQPSFFQHQVRHYDSRYTEEITADLKTIACPTQIIWGAEDRWQPVHWADRLHRDIPGSALTVIPNSGHFLMEEEPERVADLIAGFTAERE
jgi:pimeloyl-ACP methyl ester carboxylesterase